MKVTRGHKVVVAAIVAMAVFNIWLFVAITPTADDSIADYPPMELPRPTIEPQTPPVAEVQVERPVWPLKFVYPRVVQETDASTDSGFDLPKRVTPTLRLAFLEPSEADRDQELQVKFGSSGYSGVEPMPFGQSMFGPWSTGRAPVTP